MAFALFMCLQGQSLKEAEWQCWTYQEYYDQVSVLCSTASVMAGGKVSWWGICECHPSIKNRNSSLSCTHMTQQRQSLLFARALLALGFQPHGVINILGFNAVCMFFFLGVCDWICGSRMLDRDRRIGWMLRHESAIGPNQRNHRSNPPHQTN